MSLSPPILCLVTDRRRLGDRLGLPPDGASIVEALLSQISAASEAGVTLIQVREPDLSAMALVTLIRRIRARTATHGVRVVVNDRIDVGLASHADGVHLKRSSVPVADARRLAPPGWMIGRSVHSLSDLAHGITAGVDYLIFGSVFPTRSKPVNWETAGLAGLEAAVTAASPLPVLAIGGIGWAQTAEVARTGAAGVAAIDAFLPTDAARIADTVHEAVGRMRMAFDSILPLS